MKKAFDSVSLKMMKKVLERIKVSNLTIKFLFNLYNKKIIDISNEFYELHDIKINSKKSEPLVLNRKESDMEGDSTPRIRVGRKKEVVQVKKEKEAIRYLGVWILEKGSKECNETVIIRE